MDPESLEDTEMLARVFTWRGKTMTGGQWAVYLGISRRYMLARIHRYKLGGTPPWCMFVRAGEYGDAITQGAREMRNTEMENL